MIRTVADAKSKAFEQYAVAGGVATETLSAIRTVTALNIQPTILGKYRKLIYSAMNVGILKGRNLGIANGSFYCAILFTYAIGLWYGAQLIIGDVERNCMHNCINGGTVLSVFFAILMGGIAVGQVAPPLNAVVDAQCAAYPMFQLMNRVPVIDSESIVGSVPGTFGPNGEAPKASGKIELRSVEFAYPIRPDIKIYNNYCLTINAGETVALVGASGR
jgi:ATP-binding cassette subfamily B (MDR/TAP) protein 1